MRYSEAQYVIDEILGNMPEASNNSGIPPMACEDVGANISEGGETAELRFVPPEDTYIQGQMVCRVGGVIVVKKSLNAPKDPGDGTIVATIDREHMRDYTFDPLIDANLDTSETDQWYYAFFPFSDHGVTCLDAVNITKLSTDLWGEVVGFVQDLSVENPDYAIKYIGANKYWKPIVSNVDVYGEDGVTMGDWAKWWFIKENKPFMLDHDAKAQYQLDDVDYRKRADNGEPSDFTDASHDDVGAWAWFPKIYKKEYMNEDNTKRYVFFAKRKIDSDYHADDFKNFSGEEIEGKWLPVVTPRFFIQYSDLVAPHNYSKFKVKPTEDVSVYGNGAEAAYSKYSRYGTATGNKYEYSDNYNYGYYVILNDYMSVDEIGNTHDLRNVSSADNEKYSYIAHTDKYIYDLAKMFNEEAVISSVQGKMIDLIADLMILLYKTLNTVDKFGKITSTNNGNNYSTLYDNPENTSYGYQMNPIPEGYNNYTLYDRDHWKSGLFSHRDKLAEKSKKIPGFCSIGSNIGTIFHCSQLAIGSTYDFAYNTGNSYNSELRYFYNYRTTYVKKFMNEPSSGYDQNSSISIGGNRKTQVGYVSSISATDSVVLYNQYTYDFGTNTGWYSNNSATIYNVFNTFKKVRNVLIPFFTNNTVEYMVNYSSNFDAAAKNVKPNIQAGSKFTFSTSSSYNKYPYVMVRSSSDILVTVNSINTESSNELFKSFYRGFVQTNNTYTIKNGLSNQQTYPFYYMLTNTTMSSYGKTVSSVTTANTFIAHRWNAISITDATKFIPPEVRSINKWFVSTSAMTDNNVTSSGHLVKIGQVINDSSANVPFAQAVYARMVVPCADPPVGYTPYDEEEPEVTP